MARVNWAPQALQDLEAICDHIARDAPGYAQAFADQAFEAAERLEIFLRSGRIIPEIEDEDLREIIFKGYRIMYIITGDEVDVLTVYHSAREFGPSDLPGRENE